ncbi:lipoate--protein ligase family protein [bacterium]|nr:lipoate--protein ligase family protein [bacterium]
MSINTWRWIDTGFSDGARQMAMDQAILACSEEVGMPTMRMYRWAPYCISLGYHQKLDSIDVAACKDAGIHVVRRPTGGRAVFHAEEVTYSVIIPKSNTQYLDNVAALYMTLSQGLARGIRRMDVPAELEKRSVDLHEHYKKDLSVSCFSAAARHEILVDGKKLVGSAQRHLAEGMLQHGSILIGDAHLDLPKFLSGGTEREKTRLRRAIESKTSSIGACLGRTVEYDEVTPHLRAGMAEQLNICFADASLTDSELGKIEELRSDFTLLPGPEELHG